MNATTAPRKRAARSKVAAPAPTINPETHAPSGKPWAFGIRSWNADGTSHSNFKWDLNVGARSEAPDWKPRAECGNGLHANEDGWGDWALLGLDAYGHDKIVGIVRWDPDEAVRIDDMKTKAKWMDVVLTTKTASLASIIGFINDKWKARLAAILAEQGTEGKIATGSSGHASATGDYGHASATGEFAIGASLGGGHAKASETGAIMLSVYDGEPWEPKRVLVGVFAGMVGQTYGDVTIKPDTFYRLLTDGTIEEVAAD